MRMISPKVVSRHTPDASSMETVVADILREGMSSEEKALAVWEYCWKHTYHFPAPSEERSRHHELDVVVDAVKLLNVYGYSYCFAIRALGEALYEAAGMEARSGGIGGHVIAEVYYDGKYHYLDHDQRGFSRMPDGSIASLADYRGRGRDLVFRPTGPSRPFFPSTTRPLVPYEVKHVVAGYLLDQLCHYSQHDKYRTTHSMNLALRPGERFSRSWRNVGKWRCTPGLVAESRGNGYADPRRGPVDPYGTLYPEAPRDEEGQPLTYGNGLVIYRPDLRAGSEDFEAGALAHVNVAAGGPGFGPAVAGKVAWADFRTRLPYVIAGWPGDLERADSVTGAAVISGVCVRRGDGDCVRVLLSVDNGRSWTPVWTAEGVGDLAFAVDLSPLVAGRYAYIVRFELNAGRSTGDARIVSFGLDTACQLNPAVLPAVRSGGNRMSVALESGPEVWEETIDYFDGEPVDDPRIVERAGLTWEKAGYPCLAPTERGKAGYVVYRMDAPAGRRIVWAKVGAAFRSDWNVMRAADEDFRISYAEIDPSGGEELNWKPAWAADRPAYLGHWCFEANVPLVLSGRGGSVFVKYELRRSTDEKAEGGKLVQVRLVWGCEPGERVDVPAVKVTHEWTEDGTARVLERVVCRPRENYEFEAGPGTVKNVGITLELADHPPVESGPHPLMSAAPEPVASEPLTPAAAALRGLVRRLNEHPDVATAIGVLEDPENGWARNAAAAALLGLGGEPARAALKRSVGREARAENCYVEMTGLEGPLAEVVEWLSDPKPSMRLRGAQYLGRRGEAAGMAALETALAGETDLEVRAAAAAALLRLGGVAKIPAAMAVIDSCDLSGKMRIAEALAVLGDRGGIGILGGLASDVNPVVRFRAAEALAASGRAEAEQPLLKLAGDSSRWVRQAALAGLAACAREGCLERLAEIERSDPERYLRAEAAWTARQIRAK